MTAAVVAQCEPTVVCDFPPPHASPEQVAQDLPACEICPPQVRVRLGTEADAQAIAHIGAQMFAETHASAFTPEDMQAYLAQAFAEDRLRADLADPATHFLVAHEGEQVIGFLRLHPDPAPECVTAKRPVELGRFYLDKPWIGRGVGKLLLQQAVHEAAALGYDALWLHVWDENAHARGFYEHWGYCAMCNAELAFGHSFPCLLVMQRDLASQGAGAPDSSQAQPG
jgi:GNAT superfamily N-acetyltransferase